MKYLSLFSGIGGFEQGIKQAYVATNQKKKERIWKDDSEEIRVGAVASENEGHPRLGDSGEPELCEQLDGGGIGQPLCVGYSEIDKYAIQIYEKHFNHKNYGDIKNIDPDTLPDFDLLVGGFPCQSFSIAGKRMGFADTRGTLFFEIARILRSKKPGCLLLENVKGLLSHDNGRTFKTIIATLDELGYDLQWQVLNSKNFGVPQNRERVFIIGHLRGTSRPQVFPFGAYGSENDGIQPTQDRQGSWVSCLNTRYGQRWSGEGYIATGLKQLNNPTHSNNRVYGEDGISPALNTMQGGNRQPKIAIPVLTPDRLEKRQNGRRFKEDGDPSFTLTSQDKHGVMLEGAKIRRLTPTECERLQSFPDGWTEGVSDTQRYKCLGNAVTVNVIKEIVKSLL